MRNVVFLDYDGVVNRKMWTEVDGKWVCRYGYPEDGRVNDSQAVQWVSEFCDRYGYDIVVTSTWRKYPEWEQSLRNAGLRTGIRILGATSLPTRDRAEEISDYLAAHPDIGAYLVFDDNQALLRRKPHAEAEACSLPEADGSHAEHLILCCSDRGFGEAEYEKAVEAHLRLGGGN